MPNPVEKFAPTDRTTLPQRSPSPALREAEARRQRQQTKASVNAVEKVFPLVKHSFVTIHFSAWRRILDIFRIAREPRSDSPTPSRRRR
jgi:hypothetical protein